jgi:hypothetical protein
MAGTSSADPSKLEAASQAVPEELRAALASAHQSLSEKIAVFNRGEQSPERIRVSDDAHAGALQRAVAAGTELDVRLLHTAAAFRAAGGGHPPGFIGPVAAGGVLYMTDAALQGELARWNNPQGLLFTQRPDGGYDVRGPDGHMYHLRDAPPFGAVPIARNQQVIDLGNPDFGLVLSAAIIIGLTGGSTEPTSRSAPPSAYDYIHLDENGYPVAGPGVTGHSSAPGSLPASDAPPPDLSTRQAAGEGVSLIAGGMYEASKHMDARYQNVFRTQASFYVDPRTGERVAVVDAASIRYDNDSDEAIVTSGRLSVDDRGRPQLIARPPEVDPNAPSCPTGPQGPTMGPATTIRIPVEESN